MAEDRVKSAGRMPARANPKSEILDAALAPSGRARVEWAEGQMPVLRSIRERFATERPLDGAKVAACLHVTAETANLMHALVAGGAQAALCSANPLTVQDEVAAALVDQGVPVQATRGEDAEMYAKHVGALADWGPDITLDDGADLLMLLHRWERPVRGGAEETRTGLLRLRRLEAEGKLTCPVIAVNESRTERTFNDRYGTGQSALDGILRATNLLLAGHTLVLLGYGATGKGIAQRARGAGAHVIVCEVDPLRALEARMDAFEVMPAVEAAERGDLFVTVTGSRAVLRREHFERMKDGAVLANAGHFDVEIDLDVLGELATGGVRQVLPLVEQYDLGGDRRLNLLAQGRVVNLAAGEGHPAAVMDMSFANLALAVEHLVLNGDSLEHKVLDVPKELDEEIARLKLESLGVEIDELTPEQQDYLSSWDG
jgi:adenosylhomocysteinase